MGTSDDNLDSQWVRYEWDSFFNDISSVMKTITCRYLPPVGPRDPSDPVTKPLADFVREIPYFLTFDLIPPLSVMNEEFR